MGNRRFRRGSLRRAVRLLLCVLGYSPKKDWAAARLIPAALRYVGLLLTEIVKCNLALTRIVFAPKLEVKPHLVTFRTPLKGGFKSALADSITLTPGTITVHSEGDRLTRPLPGYAVHGRH